jgi:hypothetical protein
MLVICLGVAASNSGVIASSVPIYGDANGDHTVNMGDVVKIEREILGMDTLTPGADANIDGKINMGDVTWVERQILGLEPVYGDADGNLIVNQADVTYVEHVILGLSPLTPGCDANRDGKVTIADVTTIYGMVE